MRGRLPALGPFLFFSLAVACSSSEAGTRNGPLATGGIVGSGGAGATGALGSGGLTTGGVGAGGMATGGVGATVATGGTGNALPTGGIGTGGLATGGLATGGLATGGGTTGGTTLTGGGPTGGVGTGGVVTGGAPNTGGAGDTGGGGAGGTGGDLATGGVATGGAPTGPTAGACTIGAGDHSGSGRTTEQYEGVDVLRDGANYRMITNGWGQNWVSHDIEWLGTTLMIHDYQGSRQSNGAPAGYPSVFCGQYSDTSLDCGLPLPLASVTALNTVAAWSHPDGNGTYNVAYDVWLGDGNSTFFGLESYFMVWLRDPPGEGPAGSLQTEGVEIANAPGVWNIVAGEVNGLPIVNYVRAEGDDTHEIAFDIMDFIGDAQTRGLQMPGNDVLAVAIGFEIWEGPVTNLSLDDFCLDIR